MHKIKSKITQNMSRSEIEYFGLNGVTNINEAKILDSFYLYVDKEEQSLGRWLSTCGYWESWITSWMTKIIKPGFRCIDMGSNYGYYTRLMESLSGSNGYVYAVEANQNLCDSLNKSILRYPMSDGSEIKLLNIAASDHTGTATLNVPTGLIGGATIIHSNYEGELMIVNCDKLDNHINGHIDIIKMDIEGAEPLAWVGMTEILKNTDIIILEISSGTPSDFMDKLYNEYHVTVVNVIGEEDIVSRDFFDNLSDLVMVVLRKK